CVRDLYWDVGWYFDVW
nr:immunoglobulin heavy chain junction region [Mus musculus]